MELPIINLCKPPKDSRLLREPDNKFVKQLKEQMLNNPSAPGASTIAVLCKDICRIDQFEIKHKNVYRWEHIATSTIYTATYIIFPLQL